MSTEFTAPLTYVPCISPLAKPYGLYRIVPPPSWSLSHALDFTSLSFPTKRQPIHHLLARPTPVDPNTFLLDYGRFLRHKKGLPKPPFLSDDCQLDHCRLFHVVEVWWL
jgi:[histone H3]-trimethyl-L-lysine4 demethylase